MDDLKNEIENGMANIYSPYNTEFVAQIKKFLEGNGNQF